MSLTIGDKPIFGKYRIEIEDVSFEEYLAFVEEDISSELRGGKVIITPPANFEHESIFRTMLFILDTIGKSKSLGTAIGSRFMVKLDEKWAPEPDVIFYTFDRKNLVRPTYFDGAPNLVVEILSPSNREDDINEKLPKYLEFGVSEVWIIDPKAKSVTIHTAKKIIKHDTNSDMIQSLTFSDIKCKIEWIFNLDINPATIVRELDP